ncbi:hypothetical protein NSE01_30120 [Novosphingobium sediminis]|uniref:Zinc-finger domain-containing protein n=1 Tax=Novosphingobium sediminis TaxID=707214 RepID=A0A512AN93_9SPHN|nr:zf-HC2 domain-containing protein [Novosphingobium sediminis]GEO01180.1 hypothetical protein NSE01_30120 [Novosphingobium sediminis]
MLNCHDATFLMSQGRERKLTFSERMKIRFHASMCSGCTNFERQLEQISGAAKAFGAQQSSSDE